MKKWVMAIILLFIIVYLVSIKIDQANEAAQDMYKQDFTITGQGCLVLNYHRIRSSKKLVKAFDKLVTAYTKDPELLLYSVYEDEFKEHLHYLKKNGFHFVTPDDINQFIKNEASLPNKCALVTFDDADVSVYEHAFPILIENQIPFTLFIITGEVGNADFKGLELATWSQIEEMKDTGLATIGTHTHDMHYLEKNNNPPFLSLDKMDDFRQDTQATIVTVEEKLDFTPIYYAYPFGFGMPESDDILLESGYELIFTLRPGTVQKSDPAFFMKRVLVTKESWQEVVDWVENNY
ncbi:polysaccharide deacetylase family protein [Aquibacillus albus]|uniref:Peptidoglycan/xylan/chitin deacetylase (PgdA/CDA1 family) n=1 Tax=Aquibacillus albus TaxID=1168171 RepID=A0ABS2N3E3_9BACI|nr:polysaccharide deacetylase family protein [Aquibacillus albus]MBM7572642.1 peptidoglycan/xylan/chitin deacetylase (PgdA/CDA1 family) [Aquibacillus albus]